jgi:hypothetical protein
LEVNGQFHVPAVLPRRKKLIGGQVGPRNKLDDVKRGKILPLRNSKNEYDPFGRPTAIYRPAKETGEIISGRRKTLDTQNSISSIGTRRLNDL